jgi:hypothetical protein
VPQGSHLGPLFFILFINDVADVLDDVHFLIYADDIKIFFPVKTSNDCLFLQSKLNQFLNWCNINCLNLNVKKCKCISFSRKLNVINYDYKFDSKDIVRCDVINDLGVMLDNKLMFNVHIDYIVGKAMKCLGFVKRFGKEFKDPYVHKVLYCTYVRSVLEFASSIWSPFFQNAIDRIERVQRNFTRFALRSSNMYDPNNLPSYLIRCKLLGLSSLCHRRVVMDSMFAFDLLTGKTKCSDLLQGISLNVNPHNTRNASLIYAKPHRTIYGFNAPLERCLRNFSKFDEIFDFHLSRNQFKNRIIVE